MIYRPVRGALWDPSVFWHAGRYHAVMMYNPDGASGLEATRGMIAVSDDGVHWRDGGEITPERELATESFARTGGRGGSSPPRAGATGPGCPTSWPI